MVVLQPIYRKDVNCCVVYFNSLPILQKFQVDEWMQDNKIIWLLDQDQGYFIEYATYIDWLLSRFAIHKHKNRNNESKTN